MVSRLLLGCLSLLWASIVLSQDVGLRASVDRATVRENESLTYILRAEGQTRDRPDLASLGADFDVLETRSSMSVPTACLRE